MMNQFLKFLYDPENESPEEMRQDLVSYGVNVSRLESELKKLTRPSWIERARVKQSQFDQKLRRLQEELNSKYRTSKELAQALLGGEFGGGLQARAQVFFRNKEKGEASNSDIQSFIEDCLLLEDKEK